MDPLLQTALLTELDGQCNNFRLALDLMRQEQAAAADTNARPEALRRFWFYVQGMLAAVANISKIMYPVRGYCAARGDHLRRLLGAAVTAPFAPNARNMRNNYEHLDERIDVDWWTSPDRRPVRADYNFYPVGELEQRFGEDNCFRNYDTQTETLTFMGQNFPIRPVEQAVNDLQQQIRTHLT